MPFYSYGTKRWQKPAIIRETTPAGGRGRVTVIPAGGRSPKWRDLLYNNGEDLSTALETTW